MLGNLLTASEPAQHWRCTRMLSHEDGFGFSEQQLTAWSSDAIYSFSFRVIMRCGGWRTWAFYQPAWDELLRSKIVTEQLIILLSTQWISKRVTNNQSRIIFLLSKTSSPPIGRDGKKENKRISTARDDVTRKTSQNIFLLSHCALGFVLFGESFEGGKRLWKRTI